MERMAANEAAVTAANAQAAAAEQRAQAAERAAAQSAPAEGARRAASPGRAGGTAQAANASTIDLKQLPKPKELVKDSEWPDWKRRFSSYTRFAIPGLKDGFAMAEEAAYAVEAPPGREALGFNNVMVGAAVHSSQLNEAMVRISASLYLFLEMYVVEPSPIDIIVNAGSDEGLVAWARLVHRFEPVSYTHLTLPTILRV